tara:strand:+ start:910 stop:1107 length:198 start_codon:yes stop_codon:yes gene_type:complete
MLGSILQQKIIDEEVLGLDTPKKESKEASEFRAAIRLHIDRGEQRAKKFKVKNWYIDYTPEFPDI